MELAEVANGDMESAKQNGMRFGRLEQGLEDTTKRLDRRSKECGDKFADIFGRLNNLPDQIATAVKEQIATAVKPEILLAVRDEIDSVLNGRQTNRTRLSRYGRPAVLWTAVAVIVSAVADFLAPVLDKMLSNP
ncbi:MAG: hypothetical protein JRI80_00240 [Deltaproteobacteria bacterium]|nr:hypothetical protein [Deltaproteobacteria bacterium]